jgi:3-phenylpropionate/cinnamic acid dioxygenase small subunit
MAAAERYLNMHPRELRLELEELYAEYAASLNEERFEDWPGFFTDDCVYQIIPRENVERGLPLAIWLSEGKGYLLDRVMAIRKTMMYPPRYMRRLVTGARILGWKDGVLEVWANYLALETLLDDSTRVFNAGQYRDKLVVVGDGLKFKEKVCVYDTALVPNSLIYPL